MLHLVSQIFLCFANPEAFTLELTLSLSLGMSTSPGRAKSKYVLTNSSQVLSSWIFCKFKYEYCVTELRFRSPNVSFVSLSSE